VQRSAGIDDSPERFAADIQAKAKGQAAPHLVRAYTQGHRPRDRPPGQRHGMVFECSTASSIPGHGVRRMHAVPEKTGAALVTQLERVANEAGALLVTDATVRELYVDASTACTASATAGPMARWNNCAATCCCWPATASAATRRWWASSCPRCAAPPSAAMPATTAAPSGGAAAGCGLADLGGYQGHGSWVVPHGILMTWAVMMEGGVQLNAQGRRFHDETHGYSEAAVEVLRQPGGVAWNVFDDRRLLALARTFPDFQQAERPGAAHRQPIGPRWRR
jgi:fumarate reductase flavoprotein subunit